MTYIIGQGGPTDSRSLELFTAKRRRIENEQPLPRPPVSMDAATSEWLRKHTSWSLRSKSSTYNCLGLVFATRRTAVDPDQFRLIAADDGLREVPREDAVAGDIVAYWDSRSDLVHVGVVLRVVPDFQAAKVNLEVLSQFGFDGEYTHAAEDVPEAYEVKKISVWTERI